MYRKRSGRRENPRRVHRDQLRGQLPWSTTADGDVDGAKKNFAERGARADAWEKTPPQDRRDDQRNSVIVPDPRHEVQENGGLADFWYLDDGDILCDPRLALAS